MTRNFLQFLKDGRVVRLDAFAPRTTLLDWLRLEARSTGTKEGCAEGDCGACAVVVVRERDGRLVYEPVNSCITLLGQLDGAELITVGDLADEGVLHPVQEATARDHGSQCGFCTPGGYALGAIVSLARAAHVLGSIDPDIAEVLRRF